MDPVKKGHKYLEFKTGKDPVSHGEKIIIIKSIFITVIMT